MNFDYFIEITNKFRPLGETIDTLDKKIVKTKEEIKTLKKNKGSKSEIIGLEKEKATLEAQKRQELKRKWDEVYNSSPYFGSHWKALSALYIEERQPSVVKFIRDRHIELQYREGKVRIKKDIERHSLLDFFEIFRVPKIDTSLLPPYSVFLQFSFTLATPYISRDDEEFYICDNPVRKDKVFKVPMVSGSSWKGNMRWTAGKLLELRINDNEEKLKRRIQLIKLFGHENEAEKRYFDSLMIVNEDALKKELHKCSNKDRLRSGRLYFYPTFFNQISLEVINPHDRTTKAGTLPIYIESVPEDADGIFSLLYVPFDLMGRKEGKMKKEVAEDMELIGSALKEMMLTYGFSAKKSSGFGIVGEDINGTCEMSGFSICKTASSLDQKVDDSNLFAKLAHLKKNLPPEKVKDDSFSSFNELKQLIDKIKKEGIEND